MNKLPLLLRHLSKQVDEELEAQRRLLGLLETQEAAIVAGKPPAIVEAGRAVEEEMAGSGQRARRRDVLLEGFANLWEVKPGTLTFSSVIERTGGSADGLASVRDDLREVTAKVTRQARRIRTLASAHQRLTLDILEALFGSETEGGISDGGVLVNAEA